MEIRIYLLSVLLVLAAFSGCNSNVDQSSEKGNDNDFTIKRGTNISHWLSQSKRRGQERLEFFTEDDVEYIARLGFDHIRIPIDEEQMWNEQGAKEEEAFTLSIMPWSGVKSTV